MLPARGVSKSHAELIFEGGSLLLRDLGSTNGTFLNGEAIAEATLHPADHLAFGPVTLTLECLATTDGEIVLSLPKPPSHGTAGQRREDRLITTGTVAVDPHQAGPEEVLRSGARLCFAPGHLPGRSPAMELLYEQMEAVAATTLPVLLVGETGVGKEGLARTLHLSSARSRGPFVALNCAAIPGELLEAELFGIGKGVATGVSARDGKFRLAHGGTLFLDEIGDMPGALQAKLLRAVQEKEIEPVGGQAPMALDVRVISATHAHLEERVAAGTFRRDLYYRLAGYVLPVPPLRERREDLPALVEHFLRLATEETGRRVEGMTAGALRRLGDRRWPGNVRELAHEIRRLVCRCREGEVIFGEMVAAEPTPEAVPGPAEEPRGPASPPREGFDPARLTSLNLEELEGRAVAEALRRAGGKQVRAAKLLGISRTALYRRLQRLGLG